MTSIKIANQEIESKERYTNASNTLKSVWNNYKSNEETIENSLIEMYLALRDLGMTKTQIIMKIVDDHAGLEGFSRRSIYRSLPKNLKRPYESSDTSVENKNVSRDTFKNPNNESEKSSSPSSSFQGQVVPPEGDRGMRYIDLEEEDAVDENKNAKEGSVTDNDSKLPQNPADDPMRMRAEELKARASQIDPLYLKKERDDFMREIANLRSQLAQTVTKSEYEEMKNQILELKQPFEDHKGEIVKINDEGEIETVFSTKPKQTIIFNLHDFLKDVIQASKDFVDENPKTHEVILEHDGSKVTNWRHIIKK